MNATQKAAIVAGKIKNDPKYALTAVVDNNYDGVVASLKSFGVTVTTPEQALKTLQNMATGNGDRLRDVLRKVSYVDHGENHYTGNLSTFIKRK